MAVKPSIWHPFGALHQKPLVSIKKTKGVYLYADNGKKYIDGISSWWVNPLGHCHPTLVKVIQETTAQLDQVIFADFTHQPAEDLVQNLQKLFPQPISKVFFSDNGSTSIEVALKFLITLQPQKKTFIALKGAYHGDTFGAMSVGMRGVYNAPFERFLFDVISIDLDDDILFEDALKNLLLKKEELLGFIFEPLVQGANGMHCYSKERLLQLLKFCKQHNIPTIVDEIFTGFGRTGTYFAFEQLEGFSFDICCLSKCITGGFLPIGLTVFSPPIIEYYSSKQGDSLFLHGHSYTGNSLACAVANASVQLFLKKNTLKQIQRLTQSHLDILPLLNIHNKVKKAWSCGTILAVEVDTSEETHYYNPIKAQAMDFFLERGIYIRPLGNIIYFVLPYCVTKAQIQYIYSTLFAFLEQIDS